MRIVVQRVLKASCQSQGETQVSIANGLLIYTCFEKDDKIETIQKATHKIVNLRIFEDENARMQYNIQQAKGEILHISQFTLSWRGNKGHRPNFEESMIPNSALDFYNKMNHQLEQFCPVKTGFFGKEMQIASVNDGPVTFFLEF